MAEKQKEKKKAPRIIIGEAASQDEAQAARRRLEQGQTSQHQQSGQRVGESASEWTYRRRQLEKDKQERERLRRR